MSQGMNHVHLVGNLGAEPEQSVTQKGTTVLKMRVATSERRKKGDEWVDHTEWHSVTMFGSRADGLAGKLGSGAKVSIFGSIRYSAIDKRDGGGKMYFTDIEVNDIIVHTWGKGKEAPGRGQAEDDYR